MKKFKTLQEFIYDAKMVHGEEYNYEKSIYNGNKIKVEIICSIHGSFWQRPDKHLQGHGCTECYTNKRKTIEEFIIEAKRIHGEKFDYSKGIYINNSTKIEIICPLHGSFWQKPKKHICAEQGCDKCADIETGIKYKKSNEQFIEECKKVHGDEYEYLKTNYNGNRKKVIITCKIHGDFEQIAGHHLNGCGCPKCGQHRNISKGELEFLNYLKIPDDNEHRQKRIKPFRYIVDGIIENVIYEYLGDKWHGNPKTTESNKFNVMTKQTYGELYNKTLKKFNKLKEMGYNIKYVWESDWLKFVKGVDKELVINSY